MARSKHVETNLPDKWIVVVKNAESTASIPKGTPLVLNLSSTKQPSTDQNGRPAGFEDGLQVVLPATGGAAAAQYLMFGVACDNIANPGYGEAQVFNVANAIVKYATRAASTNSWSVSASCQSGFLLSIDTIDNAFTTVASSVTGASTNNYTLYSSLAGACALLLDSITNVVASATATTDARTVLTALKRVFLRQM